MPCTDNMHRDNGMRSVDRHKPAAGLILDNDSLAGIMRSLELAQHLPSGKDGHG